MEQKKTRIINFEVLRVLAMFFIVTQHYIYWGLKPSELYHYMPMENSIDIFNYVSMEALYLISVTGVDCFVLITGFFLIDRLTFRWKGMMNIWLQTAIYGTIVSMLVNDGLCGVNNLFPVSQRRYWFITIYMGLITIAPFLSLIAKNLRKKQYELLLVILCVMTFEYPLCRRSFLGTVRVSIPILWLRQISWIALLVEAALWKTCYRFMAKPHTWSSHDKQSSYQLS